MRWRRRRRAPAELVAPADVEVFHECPRCRGTGWTHDFEWKGQQIRLQCPWCFGTGRLRAGALDANAEAWEMLAIDAGVV